jgi:hypothetical protein
LKATFGIALPADLPNESRFHGPSWNELLCLVQQQQQEPELLFSLLLLLPLLLLPVLFLPLVLRS